MTTVFRENAKFKQHLTMRVENIRVTRTKLPFVPT